MPSPFPGMDPYLETPAYWRDFHITFLNYWREAIADRLPGNYEARLEEQFRLVEMPPEPNRVRVPDVSVLRRDPSPSGGGVALAVAEAAEPITLTHVDLVEVREVRLELFHNPGRTLVTVLELLSPTNKRNPDRGEYLDKRYGLLRRRVHLVELDLLVGGQRLPMLRPLPPGDYYALVTRAERFPDCDGYAWAVRQPLPPIRIPLRAPDPDVVLPLGEVFATAYERGRYAPVLDYHQPPPAPLRPEDSAWAAEVARPRAAAAPPSDSANGSSLQ